VSQRYSAGGSSDAAFRCQYCSDLLQRLIPLIIVCTIIKVTFCWAQGTDRVLVGGPGSPMARGSIWGRASPGPLWREAKLIGRRQQRCGLLWLV